MDKKRIPAVLAAVLAVAIASSCSLKKTVVNSTALFMDDIMDGFFEETDLKFAQEAIPGNLKLLDGLIRGSGFENDGLLLKGCKFYAMYAMGFLEDSAVDKKTDRENLKRASVFYERAKDYGLIVLKRRADFKKAVEAGIDEFNAVMPAYGKDDVETLFWTAFAWGEYINLNRNNVAAISDLPKVKAMIDRVIELDASYFYGLPRLFLIVYYSMPKMFGGDPEKAKKEYAAVLETSGGKFALTEFFMARYLAVQLQDRPMFDEMLEKVDAAPDDAIKERL
ncbi:MAG TPA: TRAP transporter TatT component family protein, partial [Candidatus Goldiibacteriota bacterium]|nr:TRAP transporter TatT component family protein [Candidatus Goldiibacteriota bacterium]